jgi:hypothetical protein
MPILRIRRASEMIWVPCGKCNQICSFGHHSAIEADLEDLESGYVYSEMIGAHQLSMREIENGGIQVDDIFDLGMRYDVEPAKDYMILMLMQERVQWTTVRQ